MSLANFKLWIFGKEKWIEILNRLKIPKPQDDDLPEINDKNASYSNTVPK